MLREKEILNEQFLPYPSLFYPFGELSAIYVKFKIAVCKIFQFGREQNLGEGYEKTVALACGLTTYEGHFLNS